MDIDAFVAYASPTSRSGKRPYIFGFHSFIGAARMDLWHHGEREPIEIIFDAHEQSFA